MSHFNAFGISFLGETKLTLGALNPGERRMARAFTIGGLLIAAFMVASVAAIVMLVPAAAPTDMVAAAQIVG